MKIRVPIDGAPFQPQERVRVVDAIDRYVQDLAGHVGRTGVVVHLEYDCGCGQSFPDDPMIGVSLDGDGAIVEFWSEELMDPRATGATT